MVWWEEWRLAIQPIELGDSINLTVVKNPTNFLFTGLRATSTLYKGILNSPIPYSIFPVRPKPLFCYFVYQQIIH